MTTTITRTFNLSLSATATAAVAEVLHLREMLFDSDERVAVFLEGFYVSLHLPSFQLGRYPDYDGDENDAEIVSKYTASEIASQKVGLRILGRKNNTNNWKEKAEIILLNRGRKQYDFLTPYLAKLPIRLLERNDALAVQLVDYGKGLLKVNDFIEIDCAVRIEVSKKNDISALTNRVEALEGTQTFTGNKTFGGFTTFGDNVAIKIKRITGITAAAQGGLVQIPHGLLGDKIIGMVVKLSHISNAGVPAELDTHATGYSYEQWHDATNINYQNHPTNSANILSKPFSVLIFYTS